MTGEMWVIGVWAALWIAGYVHWARRQDAAERYRSRRDALARITQEERHG